VDAAVRDRLLQLFLSRLSLEETHASASSTECVQLLCTLLSDTAAGIPEAARLSRFAPLFASLTRQLFAMESAADSALSGVLSVLATLASSMPALRSEGHVVLDGRHLVTFVFERCLFDQGAAVARSSPSCNQGERHGAAVALLSVLCQHNARNLRALVELCLVPLQRRVVMVSARRLHCRLALRAVTGHGDADGEMGNVSCGKESPIEPRPYRHRESGKDWIHELREPASVHAAAIPVRFGGRRYPHGGLRLGCRQLGHGVACWLSDAGRS
jgi:hypothetical protein